jgi:hypothetical protein
VRVPAVLTEALNAATGEQEEAWCRLVVFQVTHTPQTHTQTHTQTQTQTQTQTTRPSHLLTYYLTKVGHTTLALLLEEEPAVWSQPLWYQQLAALLAAELQPLSVQLAEQHARLQALDRPHTATPPHRHTATPPHRHTSTAHLSHLSHLHLHLHLASLHPHLHQHLHPLYPVARSR